jgi:membrane-bound ClpP family serine protease
MIIRIGLIIVFISIGLLLNHFCLNIRTSKLAKIALFLMAMVLFNIHPTEITKTALTSIFAMILGLLIDFKKKTHE